ncbi:putative serine protease PepD [Actinoplanes campanulatus]|uniref:Putative serine protease PepD n=1 Tax=Actinoplanes campanulatus TaxID=113559 RepID=A0A7W5ACB7_9ACTN|nr:trypsin-like peptidase domain-containing protein [Actinoplanes campanulatus]MBB3093349.1 putative serine protease PepD [Actinoplanes campanulatus]GGN02947.1 hypothetical protein GCM10010109_09100 [Actinoplanes campanulatus]GID33556.1 hypothetical protein Aca09nite_00620 [Actinoplanes campanulatus]
MNENETNPQTADAAADHSSTERVASEQPTLAQPPVAPQSGAPQSAAPQQHSAWAQSPWQQQQPVSGQPASAQPVSTQPVSAQPGQVPYGHPHYGYQSPQAGYPDYAQQQSAYQAWHAAATAQAAGGAGSVPPGWGASQAAGVPGRPGSGRKVLLAGAAALLIALTAGGVGAATALALDGGNAVNTVQSGNSSVTRVVDRSSLAQIAAAVQDSVVSITTGSGEGSGVVLTADGYIVTNNHVVSTAQGSNVTVIFADGTKTQATVVGTDERTDLAVIKATGVSDLKAATFGDSGQIQVGDTVLALGSPLGLEGSVTAGIISAKDRTIQSGGEEQQSPFGSQQQQQQSGTTTMTGLLQTDAPINPGNSGGALVNTNGEVIGINSAIATSGSSTGNIGLGFAIPSNKAKQVAESLMQGKKVSHPALGVSVTDAENGGALISNVTSGSAADKAGLQTGDVVTEADGKAIDDSDDLVAVVQAGTVGQKMTLNFTRNGSKQTVTVTLQETQ